MATLYYDYTGEHPRECNPPLFHSSAAEPLAVFLPCRSGRSIMPRFMPLRTRGFVDREYTVLLLPRWDISLSLPPARAAGPSSATRGKKRGTDGGLCCNSRSRRKQSSVGETPKWYGRSAGGAWPFVKAAGFVPTMPYDNFDRRSLNRRFPHHPPDLVLIKGQSSSSSARTRESAEGVQRSSRVANTDTQTHTHTNSTPPYLPRGSVLGQPQPWKQCHPHLPPYLPTTACSPDLLLEEREGLPSRAGQAPSKTRPAQALCPAEALIGPAPAPHTRLTCRMPALEPSSP